ncbi:Rrf2 family transcriptional regulator [candidate division KSB1 bacterium]|nr:Rrf2 family transcriptional regulator [candidate division KSB1 bacterium]
MVLSKTCNHALRATLYIAAAPDRTFVPIGEIADQLGISFHFLTKILQILTQEGILRSFKGPNGGVAFARPAAEISILEIIIAIDGPALMEKCLLGLAHCSDEHPCPIHSQWVRIRSRLQNLFADTSLKKLADRVHHQGYRLADR